MRFYDPKNPSYKWYGGRGIKVCKRWRDCYANFLADMGQRPLDRTLGRWDANGNYTPSNCHWATAKQQAANRRPRRPAKLSRDDILIIRVDRRTIQQIALDYGIHHSQVSRIKNFKSNKYVT